MKWQLGGPCPRVSDSVPYIGISNKFPDDVDVVQGPHFEGRWPSPNIFSSWSISHNGNVLLL